MTRHAPRVRSCPSPETALFALSLDRDGRAVPADVLAAARAFAAADPATAAADADLVLLGEVLASEPLERAGPDFTDRVVAAARRTGSGRTQVIHLGLVRRLAVAAAQQLAATLAWQAGSPGALMADDAEQNQTYLGDRFRADPYGAPSLERGLQLLVPGPLDGATSAARPDDEAAAPAPAEQAAAADRSLTPGVQPGAEAAGGVSADTGSDGGDGR